MTGRHDPERGWMSPEDLLVKAFAAVLAELDAEDETLTVIATECRRALNDGTPEVMRACLLSIIDRVRDITSGDETSQADDQLKLARLRAGKI